MSWKRKYVLAVAVYYLRAHSLPGAIDHTMSGSMLETRPHTTLKLHLDLGWGEQMPGQKSMEGYKPRWTREGVSFHSSY